MQMSRGSGRRLAGSVRQRAGRAPRPRPEPAARGGHRAGTGRAPPGSRSGTDGGPAVGARPHSVRAGGTSTQESVEDHGGAGHKLGAGDGILQRAPGLGLPRVAHSVPPETPHCRHCLKSSLPGETVVCPTAHGSAGG